MAPAKSVNPKDLFTGGVLQCVEAATLGLPFEVWKTHMGTYRNETTMQAFRNVYKQGGYSRFWTGFNPKMVESFLKGGILLFSKEAIIKSTRSMGMGEVYAGLVGGFGGGVAQVIVLGPCTFLVTAAVTGTKNVSVLQQMKNTFSQHGIAGFYRGGTALMLRQGSNWASRQGLTDVVRQLFKAPNHDRLTVTEEAISGVIGGALSTWNQPFEVLRIQAQAAAAKGHAAQGITETAKVIIKESGVAGLFKGIVPRLGICVWQTLFMVTVPKLLEPYGLV